MKKFLAVMVMLSVGILTLGCEPPKKTDKAAPAPAAGAEKKDAPKDAPAPAPEKPKEEPKK